MLRLLPILLLVAAPALAETRQPSPAQRAQQERMRSCNAEAKSRSLSGEQRQGFMRTCLRGQASGATQQPM
ncbi:PsiF family protein [Sabulicella glaciei]|uniref:PsiF family protein n=1 Tax=Sabulicella glaciei TaxID=2984948 RepID=A0ABT3NRA6_9PROT|nr:PsiF family protein [Roseococcus sp. MDT2-1-1]MCW8084691.1 PsiF family protein [Roseococcus sp. MDT2-1-1]